VKLVPYLKRFEGMHPISEEDKKAIQESRLLRFAFGKAKKWFDHPVRCLMSITLKGVAFILLVGVLALLLTSVGWHSPLTWSGLSYDILMARSNGQPNGAHLVSYLPIPILGLYVAWKWREDALLNGYLGLLVCALGVAIHEGIWIVAYYSVYWKYLSWGALDNVVKDVFFVGMVVMFVLAYRDYPFQKVRLKAFLWPTVGYAAFIFAWWLDGLHITTINNFQYGQGTYGVTQWWADPVTNAWEVASWVLLIVLMWVAVWRVDRVDKEPLV
jgi:hypothetical protein